MADDTTQPQAPQDTSFLGKLGEIASNPLLQGALAAYLGYAGSPRREGRGRALEEGGLAGLQTYGQAKLLQQQLPYQQALTQEMQQRAPLMKAQTTALQRQLQPITPDTLAKLDVLKSTAADPHEKATLDLLESQASAGVITQADLDTILTKYDEQKRMMELYKGQASLQQSQFMAAMWPQFSQWMQTQGMPVPAMPGATAGAAPSAASPTEPTASAAPPDLPFAPSHTSTGKVGGKDVTAYYKEADKKWYYKDDSGAWQMVP